MSTLTLILIIVAVILALLFIAAMLAPKQMHIEQSITINRPANAVFEYIKLIRNQDNYSVWNMIDPTKRVTTTGTDGTVGFIYTWDSDNKNTGAGAQEITAVKQGESITCQLRFERPMKSTATTIMRVSATGNQSTVTWVFEGPTQFPMSILTPVFKNILGKDMLAGLSNLKNVLEK